MFHGPHPGTSPASYNADQSFLLNRGLHVSSQGSHHVVSADEENHLDDRGRHRKRRGSSSRLSRSSLNSASRLSPTRESSVDSRTWDDEGQSALLDDHDERPISRLGDEPFSSNGHINLNGSAPSPMPNLPSLIPSTQLDNETTPLLPSVPVPAKDVADRRAYMHELKVLISYSVPIAGTHFLEYSLLVVTVVSLGHLGTVELAAASIANMTSNVVALSVTQGLCSALDTLCPQAYTSKPKDTSLYALRTGVLLLLLFIPQCIILWNAEWILIHMRQDPRVAERAGLYLKVLTFGLPGYGGFECVRRWLQAQGLMLAPVLTLILAAPLNVILNYLLVWGPEGIRLGFIGAPLATAISMNAMFITSLVYAVLFAPRDAWGGISWAIFQDLGLNIKLGLAGTAMVASEWWSWEIVGLASSFLGPSTLAAQSVLLTSASCFYQVPYSLSVAAAVRVGNLLGGQRPRTAKVTSRVTLYLATGIAGVNSIMLICLRHRWGRLFSSEPEVIRLVATVLPMMAAFQLADGLSGATGGLLRGAGRAPLGALINLTSYYLISLPLGLFLTFKGPKLGLQGLWLGLTLALTFTAVLTTLVIWRTDWDAETERARVRMGVDKRVIEEDEDSDSGSSQ